MWNVTFFFRNVGFTLEIETGVITTCCPRFCWEWYITHGLCTTLPCVLNSIAPLASDFRWWIADLYLALTTVFGINGSCYYSSCQPPAVPLNRTKDMCGWRHHIPHVPSEGHQEWVPEPPDAAPPPPHLFFPSGFTLLSSHTSLGPASSICIFIPLLL